jgi:MoaA/NifB/PqqE/SkfB family radical SAM enzyme
MQYVLSHYGHRYVQHLARSGALDAALARDDDRLLCELLAHGAVPRAGNVALDALAARGLVAAVGDDVTLADVRLRYARNPLEHLSRVVFEYTTVCNLDCAHCRNANLEAHATADPAPLRRVVDAMLPLGVARFDFIGGEVTLYGKGWLDLVAYLRAKGAHHASVTTSGWFLGEANFLAAGERYADDRAYLRALHGRGLTHVAFSLDGPADVHDRCRGVPGLYRRVLEGFDKAREAGLQPRVSAVVGMGQSEAASRAWLADVSERLFGPAPDRDVALRRVLGDESNYVSNFIDVGGGVQLRRSKRDLAAHSDEALRCKNFFRPSPTFRVKATGEVALCPLVEGGDGYGNVRERDVVDILNHLDAAFVSRMHAERRVGEHRRLLDAEVFGGGLGHVCAARTALNMVARAVHERGVSPDDAAAVRAINVEVAEKMGVLPRELRHRANGHARRG